MLACSSTFIKQFTLIQGVQSQKLLLSQNSLVLLITMVVAGSVCTDHLILYIHLVDVAHLQPLVRSCVAVLVLRILQHLLLVGQQVLRKALLVREVVYRDVLVYYLAARTLLHILTALQRKFAKIITVRVRTTLQMLCIRQAANLLVVLIHKGRINRVLSAVHRQAHAIDFIGRH